MLSIMCDTIFA